MKMLLCQNFCGRHHRGLLAIHYRQQSCCRCNHGLAAAHIALDQPVHRLAGLQIGNNFLNCPHLSPCQGKWQSIIKVFQVGALIGRRFLGGPLGTHKGQACGEDEKFLENKPLFGLLHFFPRGGGVDGAVCPVGIHNAVGPSHLRRQDLCRGIANGHGLGNGLCHGIVGKTCGQGIDGQNATGLHRGRILVLIDGIDHTLSHPILPEHSMENEGFAVF